METTQKQRKHLRLDPWRMGFSDEFASERPNPKATIDTLVETDAPWTAIQPPAETVLPRKLFFVDGVRRIEARCSLESDGETAAGIYASHAVGSVEVADGRATFGQEHIHRHLLVIGQSLDTQELAEAVRFSGLEVSLPKDVTQDSGPLLSNAMQREMRRAESDLIISLPVDDETLIIADGPLQLDGTPPRRAVGYIKRLIQPYLTGKEREVLRQLPAHHRTPIFSIANENDGFKRWTWFVRLARPLRGETDFAGLARIEIPQQGQEEAPVQLADQTCLLLPRFAPKRHEDPRAPQNLRPIAALEKRLRRMLGDPKLIRHYIESHLARLDEENAA